MDKVENVDEVSKHSVKMYDSVDNRLRVQATDCADGRPRFRDLAVRGQLPRIRAMSEETMLGRHCVGFWNLADWISIWVGLVSVCKQRTEQVRGNLLSDTDEVHHRQFIETCGT